MRGQVPDGALPPQDLESSDLPRCSRRPLDHPALAHDRRTGAPVGENVDDVGVPGRLPLLRLGQQRGLAAVADPYRTREARPQARHQVDLVPLGRRRTRGCAPRLVEGPGDGDGQGAHVVGPQPSPCERLGDEPVQDREPRRRVEIGLHVLRLLGQRRSRQVREQDLDVAHIDVRAQDDGALAAEPVASRRSSAGHAGDRLERGDPAQVAKVGQGGVDAGSGQAAVIGDLGSSGLSAVDEPVKDLQGVELPDSLGTNSHPACHRVLRPWVLGPR